MSRPPRLHHCKRVPIAACTKSNVRQGTATKGLAAQDGTSSESRTRNPELVSCKHNILSDQSVVDCDRKITPYLNPILVPIRPSTKLKSHGCGGQVNHISLGFRFFRDSW